MLDENLKQAIRHAFKKGDLRVQTVDPTTGQVSLQVCSAVLKHQTPHKNCVRITVEGGTPAVFTEDHSVFHCVGPGVQEVEAGRLVVGDSLATVEMDKLTSRAILSVEHLPPREVTYDLSVPGPQNFVLANGVLAHNSYSIGGISLDINKSSSYEGLKNNAEGRFDQSLQAKRETVFYIKGLKQPKYGMGIRSAFGPNLSSGTVSPRNFI